MTKFGTWRVTRHGLILSRGVAEVFIARADVVDSAEAWDALDAALAKGIVRDEDVSDFWRAVEAVRDGSGS